MDGRATYGTITDLSVLLPPGLTLATNNQETYLEEVNLRGEVAFIRGRVGGGGVPGNSIPVCVTGLYDYYGLQGVLKKAHTEVFVNSNLVEIFQ